MDLKADGECPVSSGTGTSAVISWSGPRTVIVPRTEAGFGFTLRHFIVYPPESSISSQIQDGETIVDENDPEVRRHKRTKLSDLEPMDTIFVKHVKEESPAHKAGLNPGDRIVSVNGESVTGKTYSQVIALIQSSDSSLKLLVVPKDEDILQMAYQNTAYNQAGPEIFPDPGINIKHINQYLPKDPPVFLPEHVKDRKVSFTFEETHSLEPIFTTTTIREINPRPLVNSASYTSGICLQREPLKNDNMNKTSFLDRKREFELRASQVPERKIDSYSFGLYYPPKQDQQKANSIDNIYITSSSRRRTSRENVLQSRESFENVSRSESHFQTSYNSKGPGYATTPRSISSENKQFPRSRTTSSLSSIANSTTQVSSRIELTPSDRSNSSSYGANSSTCTSDSSALGKTHYVPTHATSTPIAPRSLQIAPNNRGNQYSYQNSKSEKIELTSPTRSQFVFKATCGTSSGNRSSSISTPGLPNTYCNRPLVVQRKQQFETSSNNSSNSSSGAATPNSSCSSTITSVCVVTPKMLPGINRYKTEIEKITSRAKFESVASRAAQFETKSESIRITPPVFTPPAKMHRASVERTPESGSKYPQSSERTSTYKASLTKSLSTPTSPSQETLPIQSDKLLDSFCHYESTPTVNYSKDSYKDESSMPQLDGKDYKIKANYIATINAAINNSDSSLLGMSSCTDSKDDFFSSANYGGSDVVILRKKSDATSPEHDAVKLQRRTSYLMATARERTELNLPVQHPLDRLNTAPHALDPMHTLSPGGLPQAMHPKKPKPATLMEEKSTPSIAEEQQQQQPQQHHQTKTELPPQPPSPQFETLKEGNLSCKSAIIDGKRSSDRSWKTYLVLLKGHELYLQDKRKEGNTNSQFLTEMEQPVSVKGSSVDVATNYTKKKYVFRLITQNGSEFLFQADDYDTMMSWIQAIKPNSELVDEMIKMGETEATPAPNTKSSPQMPSKSNKKLSGLSFRPKITHSPNQTRRKPNEEGSKTKRWKGKLDRFKKKGNNTAPVEKPNGCFGIPLEICIQSPYKEGVPFMVDLCTRIVEARGLEVVGVYRVPGNKLAISMMQEELNRGIDHINLDNEKWLDVNVISSLLKSFFRKLPNPLVTNELYPNFIKANQIEPAQKRMLSLKQLLHKLPYNHFETFRHLALHLRTVADHSSINKMGARNLAIVLGPTLIRRSDEDVQGMAVDMSHQCRIIERIILHPDWFFSSWDEDCYVPSEENGSTETTPSPVTNPIASPDADSLEEVEEINPRDILEDMIAAANRKIQANDKKNVDEPDVAMQPAAQYEERDIDAEVAKHQAKIQASLTDLHSASSQSQLDTISYSSRVTNERKASASSSSIGNDDLMDSTFLSKVHGSPQATRHLSRHYSNESLVEKSDELELSHGLNHAYSLSQDTLNSLRALRELDAQHQRESEQRRMEFKKIDQEYLRTKEEIEMEDQHSIEDLLNPKKRILSSYSTGYTMTSTPYSTLFDDIDSVLQQPGKGWLTPSPSSSSAKANEAVGGMYFVSVGNSKTSDKRTYHLAGLDSNKRSNSLEAMLDAAQPWCSSPNSRKYCDTDSSPLQESDLCIGLGNSLRRGSLDSMIDFYDKHESRLSWASTDSEDGSDLLTSLTTTFDQKLKILLNPSKYKLNGNSRPRSTASSTLPSTSPSPLTSLPPPTMALSPAPTTMSRYTDAGPISIVNDVTGEERDFNGDAHAESTRMLNLGLAYSWQAKKTSEMFDSFRDPSLHRSQKSETKIGIASRFTRSNSNPTPHIPGERAIITHGAAPIAASHLASSEFAQRRNNGAGINTDRQVRYLSSITDTPSLPKNYYLRKNMKSFYDKGSSLSSDNSTGAKTGFSVLMGKDLMTKDLMTKDLMTKDLMTKADINPLLSTNVGKVTTNEKHRSTSPPVVPRRKVRGRRRHTVGGSEDMKHYNTLVTLLTGREESERALSAWERLRPLSKASEMYEQLPLAWLNKNCPQSTSPELDLPVQPLERTVRKV